MGLFGSERKYKLLPLPAMEPVLYWPGPELVNQEPAHSNVSELEEEDLLLRLCGQVLVMQKHQSAAAAGGFSCQERPP